MKNIINDNSRIDTELPSKLWPVYRRGIHVYETDKDGVVHFSNYLRIAEEALFYGFRTIGFPFESEGNSVAMLKTDANYYYPVKFGDSIDVTMIDVTAARVKFSLTFDFLCKSKSCARLRLTLATIASSERQSIPLNKGLKNVLNTLLTGSN